MSLQDRIGTTFRDFGDLGKSETELLKAVEMAKGKNEIQYLRAIDRLSALKIEQGAIFRFGKLPPLQPRKKGRKVQ